MRKNGTVDVESFTSSFLVDPLQHNRMQTFRAQRIVFEAFKVSVHLCLSLCLSSEMRKKYCFDIVDNE